jgi:two-component system LytT family response regulator
MVVVPTREIDWVEGAGNYVRLHCGAASYLLRQSVGGLEARLDPRHFARVHRSTIVRIDQLAVLETAGGLAIGLRDGTRLAMSRTYRSRVVRLLDEIPRSPSNSLATGLGLPATWRLSPGA